MADEETTGSEIENVTVSKTELEALRAQAAQVNDLKSLKEIDDFAKSKGFRGADEYIESLEDLVQKPAEQAAKPEVKIEPKPTGTPTPNDQFAKQLGAVSAATADAFLRAHYVEFATVQAQLPEEDRYGFDRKELDSLIRGNTRELIFQLAQDIGGNVYEAAANYKLAKSGAKEIRERVLKAEAAKAAAAGTVTQGQGGRAADQAGAGGTSDRAKFDDQRRDEIAPKTVYKMPTSYRT